MDMDGVTGDVMLATPSCSYACYHPGSSAGCGNWSVRLAWMPLSNMRGVSLKERMSSTCMTGETLARLKRSACHMCGTRLGGRESRQLRMTTHQANGFGTLTHTNHQGDSRNE